MIDILLLPFMCLSLAKKGVKDSCQGTFKTYENLNEILSLLKESTDL